jgi:hypothetical protein
MERLLSRIGTIPPLQGWHRKPRAVLRGVKHARTGAQPALAISK